MEVTAFSPVSSTASAVVAGSLSPKGWRGRLGPLGQRMMRGWALLVGGLFLAAAGGLLGCSRGDGRTASGESQRPSHPTGSDSRGAAPGVRPTFPPIVKAPVWTPPPIGVLGEEEVTPTPAVLLPVRLVGHHVGEYVEITLDNGKVLRVIVLAVSDRSLKVTETVGGGEIRYEVPRSTVKGFQLAR